MVVTGIKTQIVTPGSIELIELIDQSIPEIEEGTIIAITSKIVSLCEGRVVNTAGTDKEELIKQESDYFLPSTLSAYGYHFTIRDNSMTSAAGIDESNTGGYYVLWPSNPQNTVNKVREHLANKYNLKNVGVIITDSTCTPLRRGTVGQMLAYSGFEALSDYRGTPDLFGRKFEVSVAGIGIGLACAAVLVMGEGTEQTPIVKITNVPFVKFQNRNPNAEELALSIMNKQEDLFEPFLKTVPWQKGGRQKS